MNKIILLRIHSQYIAAHVSYIFLRWAIVSYEANN